MEFDKKTKIEEAEHADSEAPKKVKKKRVSKEKKTDVTIKKRIKAPVPAEILAEEDKKADEEKPKAKRSKKKAKKATVAGAVTTAKQEHTKHEADLPDPIENKGAKGSEVVPQKETTPTEETEVSADSREKHAGQEVPGEESHSDLSSESFEKTILPHEVEEEEGELFISERLRRLIGRDENESEASPETAEANVAEDKEESTPPASATSSTNKSKQSHQTAASQQPTTSTPPKKGAAGSGGSGAVPPLAQAGFPSSFSSPNSARTAANQAPASADTTPYRNRSAERRNLVAGIIVGGIIEHIRHKRREKRLKTAHKKEIEKLKETQQFQAVEQRKEKRASERTKTALEKQLERLKQKNAPATSEVRPKELRTKEQPAAVTTSAEAQKKPEPSKPEAIPAASLSFYEDFKRKYRSTETVAAAAATAESKPPAKTSEKPAPVPKQQPENIDEPIQVSPDRRVETSAWHRIEVDKKTGQAVENPELAYGEEFQNEQHQEQLRKQIDEASINSEEVRQNYMPMVDKTASTVVQTHDSLPDASSSHRQKPEKISSVSSSLNDTLQDLRGRAGDSTVVDYVLVGILFLIIIAIIALLI